MGGREDDAGRDLAAGFAAGVRSQEPWARVETAYIGEDYGAANAVARAGATSRKMFGDGVGVIFAAAGPSNAEIAAVANKRGKLIIRLQNQTRITWNAGTS